MKRLLVCLFVLAVVMASCSAFAANMEFVPNAGFEDGTGTAAAPWYNQAAWGTCTGQAVTTQAHAGLRSWETLGAALGAQNTVEQIVPLVAGGLKYAVSYWVKIPSASVANPVKVDIRAWFGTPENLYISGFFSVGGSAGITITTSDWIQVTDGVGGWTPDATCNQVVLRARITSTDPAMVAYVDDASVTASAHTYTGKVVDTSNAPIGGAKVYVGTSNPPYSVVPSAITAADGTYTVAVADDVEHYIMAQDALGWYGDSTVETLAASTVNGTVPDLVLTALGTYKITGKVVDSVTKAAMAGVTIGVNTSFDAGFNTSSIMTTTAADGSYSVDVLDPNASSSGVFEYYVVAKKTGYIQGETYVTLLSGVVNNVKTVDDLELVVDPEYNPNLLVNLKASGLAVGTDLASWTNTGTLGGSFDKFAAGVGPNVAVIAGKKAVEFIQLTDGGADRRTMASVIPAPSSLSGSNPWTISSVVYRSSGQRGGENSYFQWAGGAYADGQSAIFRYTDNGAYIHWGMDSGFQTMPSVNAWHNVTITYDGANEVIYVDGVLDRTTPRTLSINPGGLMMVGGRTWHDARGEDQYWRFNGAIASIKVFDKALSAEEVATLAAGATHTITVTAGEGGSVSPSTTAVGEGDSPIYHITPNLGYKILDVLVDGVSNPAAVAAGNYTFTNVTTTHTISATFEALPQQLVSGKVTNGTAGLMGAKVYFKTSANAAAFSNFTTTTVDAEGNFSILLPPANWFACASADTYDLSADVTFTVAAAPVVLADIVLTYNPNWDVVFSVNTDDLSPIDEGARINSWNGLTALSTWNNGLPELGPIVETIGTIKWEKNVRANYNDTVTPVIHTRNDGFKFGGDFTAPILANGASIVTVVRPVRNGIADAWTSIVDVFQRTLVLGIRNDSGLICVWRNNTAFAGPEIPDGQKTVLSMVVQPTGEFKVWANGELVMNETTTSDMTALNPGAPAWEKQIYLGRGPDQWAVFNGNIGDTVLYKNAISDEKREALQAALAIKFDVTIPVFTTISGKVTLGDGVTPVEGAVVTSSGSVTSSFTTGSDGLYSVNAEQGTFVTVTALKDSFLMVYPVDGQYDFTVGTEPVVGKDFMFTPINTITGIVKDASNNPINNAVVQVGGIGGPGALTGPDGKYMISGITIGSVELYGDALGYAANTQTIDSTPAASGPFNVDITLTAKEETGVIKNGGFEQVTAGVPNDWTLLWIKSTSDWSITYTNPVAGNTDTLSATTDCVTGTYAGKYTTTSAWTFMTQEFPVMAGNTYNFYMKLKADAGVPFIFPIFAFRNDANDELGGYVSAEAAPYREWAFVPPTTWKSFLHWNTYGNGLARVPSLRLTPPAGTTKVTVWIGFTDSPAGKAVYVDDVVIDRVGPDTVPAVDVASIKDLKAQSVGTVVKLVGTQTVTLTPTAAGVFYIGDASRISGLRVVKSGSALVAGNTVTDLVGTVKKTAAGEVYLELDAVPVGTAGTKMAPLAMNNKAASVDPKALSNLVKVWGKVTVSGSDFTISDGYSTPITVLANGATLPAGFDGSTAVITGVVSKDDAGNTVILLGEL